MTEAVLNMEELENNVEMEESEVQEELEVQELAQPEPIVELEKPKIVDIPGVGAATAEKLDQSGYHDMMSIAVASIGQLCEASGVSEAVARKMINHARDTMKWVSKQELR